MSASTLMFLGVVGDDMKNVRANAVRIASRPAFARAQVD